jgi:hypothetical protein
MTGQLKLRSLTSTLVTLTMMVVLAAVARASDEADLAREALNPVAALISLPMKYAYNGNIGPIEQGNQSVLTIQSVIRVSFSAD